MDGTDDRASGPVCRKRRAVCCTDNGLIGDVPLSQANAIRLDRCFSFFLLCRLVGDSFWCERHCSRIAQYGCDPHRGHPAWTWTVCNPRIVRDKPNSVFADPAYECRPGDVTACC